MSELEGGDAQLEKSLKELRGLSTAGSRSFGLVTTIDASKQGKEWFGFSERVVEGRLQKLR